MNNHFDISLGLDNIHVVVTGAAGQIGQVIINGFLTAGSYVSGFDIASSRMTIEHERLSWYTVDITDEDQLEAAFSKARTKFGIEISACVAAAGLDLSFIPHHASICDMPLDQWKKTIDVNITGTFLTARTWLRHIAKYADDNLKNVSLIILGSEAGVLGVPGNADYATSKSAIQYGLTRSLAPEAARIFSTARVNAIAPGAVNTPQFQRECTADDNMQYRESEATVATMQSISMAGIARICLMLTSENYSSNVSGQILQVDGGKTGRILWDIDGQAAW